MGDIKNCVFGIDFGTDSVRGLLVDCENGNVISQAIFEYPRWKEGRYCDSVKNQFRQHPLDYMEGLEYVIRQCLLPAPELADSVKGISIDTTGSTPVAVDRTGTPLALLPRFENDPDAMFILWKDHTAIKEAAEINEAASVSEVDYTKYVGGIYSSEWFWAKILKTIRSNPEVRDYAFSWVEHCDWITFLLTGGDDISKMKRSRCAAGHKAMWHREFGGLPPNSFFASIDPLLDGLVDRLFQETVTSEKSAGNLSEKWARTLGLSTDVHVGIGAFDAHMGAVGGQVEPYYLSKVMGTSTCDILIAPMEENEKLVRGICGQVDGSVIPGFLGMEAGQSGFGDIYAWFRDVIGFGVAKFIEEMDLLSSEAKYQLKKETYDKLLIQLSEDASVIEPGANGILSLDWMNGRRTPDANQELKGWISNLNLASDAPAIFRSLVESTCYGARRIVERFENEGVPIKGLIGLGGVAKKSPFIMQIMADVMNRPIRIAKEEQTCAMGAAMFAATASGVYNNVLEAMEKMGSGFETEFVPDPQNAYRYEKLYAQYVKMADFVEEKFY